MLQLKNFEKGDSVHVSIDYEGKNESGVMQSFEIYPDGSYVLTTSKVDEDGYLAPEIIDSRGYYTELLSEIIKAGEAIWSRLPDYEKHNIFDQLQEQVE